MEQWLWAMLKAKTLSKNIKKENTKELELKHKATLLEIQSVAGSIFKYMEKNSWRWKINWYKNYMMYNFERAIELKKNWMERRTNFKTPLSRIFTDTLYNKLFDNEFAIDIYATTPKWDKKTETKWSPKDSFMALNEWAYITSEIEVWLKKSIKDWVSSWDWYWRVDMSTPKEMEIYVEKSLEAARSWDPKWYQKWIPVEKCSAVYEYIPWEEIIYDIKKDFYDSSFVWRRRIEEHSKFIDRRWSFISINQKTQDELKSLDWWKWTFIFNKDYSWHRRMWQNIEHILSDIIPIVESDLYEWVSWEKWESYEHWTNETLTIIRNGVIVYDWENPLGIGMHPFIHFWLGISPNWWVNLWITQLLMGIQELYDLVYNWYADYLKRHFNPMFMTTWWQWIEWFDTWYMDWEPYKIIKNLGDGKLENIKLWDDVENWFMLLDRLRELGWQITWVNRYTWANVWSGIERSARASDYQVQITLETLKPIVFWISRALTRASKIRWLLAQTKLPPKIIVSIMGKSWEQEFKKITIEDLKNDYVIKYKSESIGDYMQQRELDKLTSFLNYQKIVGTDPITNTFVYNQRKVAEKVAELHWFNWIVLSDEQIIDIMKDRQEKLKEIAPPENNFNQGGWEWWVPDFINENGTQDNIAGFEPVMVDE